MQAAGFLGGEVSASIRPLPTLSTERGHKNYASLKLPSLPARVLIIARQNACDVLKE
ncbi:hypothetical protein SAMN04488001_2697 [Litoreibacter albidus]|uniref:Uncharacterized protein n=1 Tax=Litoreibacter albidus TaxID=670155 RepID=A0A1H3A0R3_9RHOB|nr:hypothetical protein SAMN04488001_2697 [Litoreibacter albidus]